MLEVQAWVATHEIAKSRDADLAAAPAGRDLVRWNPEQLLGIGLEEQVVQALAVVVEDQRFEAVLTLLRADDVVPHDPRRFEWHELVEHLDDVDGIANPLPSQADAAPALEPPHRHEGQHLSQKFLIAREETMRREVAVEAMPLEAAGKAADHVAGFVHPNVGAVPEEPGDGQARDASTENADSHE